MTQETETMSEGAKVAALVQLAEAGIPPDIQELLTLGNPMKGVAPGALWKAIAAWNTPVSTNKDETIAKLLLELDDAYGRAVCFSDGCVGCADNARSIHRALTSTKKEG